MTIEVEVQYVAGPAEVPAKRDIRGWVEAALRGRRMDAEVTVRIVGAAEGAEINRRWRNQPGPTNVLSFASEGLEAIAPAILGDVVICAPVVTREAAEQHKEWRAHWAHMVVHGVLHLLGFDHVADEGARAMERLETEILRRLGYPDPYTPCHSS